MGQIKDIINQILDKQNAKGMKTYGHSLEDCPNEAYDWNIMALEEAIDGWQYQVKENLLIREQLRKEKERRIQLEQILRRESLAYTSPKEIK